MNETLDVMMRALFKPWFVDFDPVRAKMEDRGTGMPGDIADPFPDRLVDSEMEEVPEGWEVVTLGDVAVLRQQVIDPASVAGDTPYIGLADIPRGSTALTVWRRAADVSRRTSALEAGDILFGKVKPGFYKVGFAPLEGLCSTDILALDAPKPQWSASLLALVSSPAFIARTSQTPTGNGTPRTGWRAMVSSELCWPANHIAAEFQRFDGPILRQIRANIHESRTLAALRDTLLSVLMSGAMRIREAAEMMGRTRDGGTGRNHLFDR
ncbi:MAG: restriction endonuclease subunit S [Bacteroidota bacterium]|nr:restriction endonuclease subunit S [Bacteroidota bacterium]MDE2835226.1 restriction endonuclease subunit S [Bacteroidota bacterium]